jgi:hypothetical protein
MKTDYMRRKPMGEERWRNPNDEENLKVQGENAT